MSIFSCLSLRRPGVGWFRSAGARVGLAVCGAVAVTGQAWGKGAEKPVTLSLVDLGQQVSGGRPQVPGSTQVTVNFVGDHHLLVTFPVRRLMKRLAECEPDDEDRTIDAVLVDVPSGKVAARTSWRVHDSGQYLWDLGRGRFLVRVRNRLVTVAPLQNLSTERPFEERGLLAFEERVVGVLVAAEGDLLTVETRERRPAAAAGTKQAEGPVEIHFFRLEEAERSVRALSAGRVVSGGAIEVPMTSEGYLDTSEEAKGRWVFDYIAHGGKKTELSPYDTSCFPVAKFVSRSEFVAFGCRGSAEKMELGGFDMRGEEMWQQNMFESFVRPTFSFAPEVGRFALGRSLTVAGAGSDPVGEALTGQDVVVMQAHTGKQLFHTVLTPVQRSGQNFALAPDGMEVAVVRGATIEVHRLPALSGKDQQEVREARAVELERAAGAITMPTRSRVVMASAAGAPAAAPVPAAISGPVLGTGPAAVSGVEKDVAKEAPRPAERTVQVGDAEEDGPRKKPTLYGEGEKPQ